MEAIGAVVYVTVLGLVGCAVVHLLFGKSSYAATVYVVFLVAFGIRIGLTVFNETFELIPEKYAGEFSLDVHRMIWESGAEGGVDEVPTIKRNFLLPALLNLPGFLLFGTNRWTLIFTNGFLATMAAVVGAAYLDRLSCRRAATWGLLLLAFYPAALNFSIFGLRDPIIYFLVTVYCGAAWATVWPGLRRPLQGLIAGVALLLIMLLRIELLPILLVLPFAVVLGAAWRASGRFRTNFEKRAVRIVVALLLLAVTVPVAATLYRETLSQIGVNRFVNPVEIVEVYAEQRYLRDPEGSNILPEPVYRRTSPVTRFVLQTIGIVVLPYPWLITDVSRALAGLDSLVLMACLWVIYYKHSSIPRAVNRLAVDPAMLAFWAGVLVMGLLVVNAGNALRMRMSLVPFALLSASVALARGQGREIESSEGQE